MWCWMLVFYDLSGAVWINVINNVIIKTLCFSTEAGRIRFNRRPGCSQVRCCLMAWPFGWNPRPALGTCTPCGERQEPQKKNPNPTPTEQGQNDRKTGGQDWVWTHPTSGEKVSEGRGWKGSGQWHEFASLTVRSTAFLWVRGNPPLQWLRSTS